MARQIIKHYRTTGATAPNADVLSVGEIAIGYGKNNETLYIKNSAGEIIKFKSNSELEALRNDFNGHISAFTAYTGATQTALNGKASVSDFNDLKNWVESSAATKSSVEALDTKIDNHITAFTAYTGATQTALNGKASVSDFNDLKNWVESSAATKSSVEALDTKIDNHITTFTAYQQTTNNALAGKASDTEFKALSGWVHASAATKSSVTTLETSINNHISAFTTYTGEVETTYAKKSDITTVFKYSGSVNTVSDLPTITGNTIGNLVFNVVNSGITPNNFELYVEPNKHFPAGSNFVWNGNEKWDILGGTVDLTPYALREDLSAYTQWKDTVYKIGFATPVDGNMAATTANVTISSNRLFSETGVITNPGELGPDSPVVYEFDFSEMIIDCGEY